MASTRNLVNTVAALGLALALAGCNDKTNNGGANDAGEIFDPDGGDKATATLSGFAWDPEAFWWYLGGCMAANAKDPTPCFPSALLITGLYPPTLLEYTFLPNAVVSLFDPLNPMDHSLSSASTLRTGSWSIYGVPARALPPFLPVALTPPSPAPAPVLGPGPMGAPPVPPAHVYLPTLTLKPISTGDSTLCLYEDTAMLSDNGILQALATHLGKTVPDLLSPQKSGGVMILWTYVPGLVVRVPAFGVTAQVALSGGATMPHLELSEIRWNPPGAPAEMGQSERGFIASAPGQNKGIFSLGLWAITVPPLTGPPPAFDITLTDPAPPDPVQGHPYVFPPLQGIQLAPGLVSFLGLGAATPGQPKAPRWFCLPPSPM